MMYTHAAGLSLAGAFCRVGFPPVVVSVVASGKDTPIAAAARNTTLEGLGVLPPCGVVKLVSRPKSAAASAATAWEVAPGWGGADNAFAFDGVEGWEEAARSAGTQPWGFKDEVHEEVWRNAIREEGRE